MPYEIVKGGGTCKASEYAVLKKDGGKTMGCHSLHKDAEDQIAAIYANEGNKMPENFSHIARARLVKITRFSELSQIVKERFGVDGAEDSSNPPFFWEAEISNDLLDSHFTHMSSKTLENYARDAEAGVAFLRGHNWHELPIGYSVTGRLDGGEGAKRSVKAEFYTVTGLKETDDLVARIKTGLLRDVSVGFHGGRMVCDICQADFWDCRHFPGLSYEEKVGDTVTKTLSTFTIDDASLSEVSGVFDGSTPDAMITKAQRFAQMGELTQQQVDLLEQRYRVRLSTKKTMAVSYDLGNLGPIGLGSGSANSSTFSVGNPGMTVRSPDVTLEVPSKERKMDEKDFESIKDSLVKAKIRSKEEVEAMDDTQLPLAVATMAAIIVSLEPQAEEGRQYRNDLVAEAIAEGVRAQGNDFDKALYEPTLRTAPLAVVKRMRDDWRKVANATLPAGRTTTDTTQKKVVKVNDSVPDIMYQ